jgi:Cof subfamily protein (haloacid dehalogenase superfamily)
VSAVIQVAPEDRWLVALDVDGTLLTHRGDVAPEVVEAVRAAAARGHEVMLATGRSLVETIPVLRQLDIWPEYVVSSNGAMLLKRDPLGPDGYSKYFIETFNPEKVLKLIKGHLPEGCYAVEDENGNYYYTEPIPGVDPNLLAHQVDFDGLLNLKATRVVVVSPDHDTEDFLQVVERIGLKQVSYTIGWAAWLDIAPEGISKASALEKVREALGFPRSRIFAAGDGNNDIQMIEWAAELGRGVAMGNAEPEIKAVANEVCGNVEDLGLLEALNKLP